MKTKFLLKIFAVLLTSVSVLDAKILYADFHSLSTLLDQPSTICNYETLWQIGHFDDRIDVNEAVNEFKRDTNYYESFEYYVDTDSDQEITAPNFPGWLSDSPETNRNQGRAKEVHIRFSLGQDYNDSFLSFSSYGADRNEILLDSGLLTTTVGVGEGQRSDFVINVGSLFKGDHVITLKYPAQGKNGDNAIDAISLKGANSRTASTLVWGVGHFAGGTRAELGGKEYLQGGPHVDIYDYDVDTNGDDEINAPDLPGYVNNRLVEGRQSARRINLSFNWSLADVSVFRYSRYGSETNNIFLDETLIAGNEGPGENVNSIYTFPLGVLTQGSHIISIEYDQGGLNIGNYIDAMGVCTLDGKLFLPIISQNE